MESNSSETWYLPQQIDLLSLANHSLKCISKSLTSNITPKIAGDSDQYIPASSYYDGLTENV